MRLISELRRRNVLRMAVLYVVATWLVMQVAGVLMDLGVLPQEVGPWVIAVLVVGLPIALVASWLFDITPEGVVRDADVAEAQPALAPSGRRTDFIIIAMLAAAVILLLVWEPPASADEALTVLPFDSMTGPDEASFAEGVSIELQTLIAQLRKFKVKQPPEASILAHFSDIPTLAKEMDVRWVLKGSVRHADNRVRIAVQLVDAHDKAAIAWSNVFDRELSAGNLFAIQTEIARTITSELRFSLDKPGEMPLAPPPTQNTEAYNAYLVGRQRLTDRRIDWLEDAIEQFAHAIDLDPDFGKAYSGLVDACFLYEGYSGGHEQKSCPADKAEWLALARKAVRLAPDSGEAWVSLGNVIDISRHRLDDRQSKSYQELSAEAEDAYKRGISLNPSYSQGYHWYALYLRGRNEGDARQAAWKVVEQGLEVDPLSLQLHRLTSFPWWVSSREESLWHARRIVEIAPDSPTGYARLAEELWENHGRADEAVRLLSKAARLDPRNPDYPEFNAAAYLALGDYDMALAYFRLTRMMHITDTPNSIWGKEWGEAFALLYAGRTQEAIEGLEALLDTPYPTRAYFHAPLNVLAGIDLADGHPERALSRFRQHRPECFADVEIKDLSGWCPALALVRILEEVGDEEQAQKFVLEYTPEVGQEKWDNFWSHLDYRKVDFVRARYEAIAGRHEQALTMLEDLVAAGFRGWLMSEFDWRFLAYYDITLDSIRDHPRFQAAIAVIEADMAQQLENVRAMQLAGEVPTLEDLRAELAAAGQ